MDSEGASQEMLKAIFDKVNSEDSFARLIGMSPVELKPGFARTILSITNEKVNMYQMAHGGAIFSVADQAFEATGNNLGEPAISLEATARLTQRSNRVSSIEFEVRNQAGTFLARGQQLIYFTKRGVGAR